jgi:hypothetical protein
MGRAPNGKKTNNNTDGQFCLRDAENPLTYLHKSLSKYWRLSEPPPYRLSYFNM